MRNTISYIYKTLLSIILIIISITLIVSCTKKQDYIIDAIAIAYKDNIPYLVNDKNESYSLKEYDQVIDIFNENIAVRKNKKYGFIDRTGKEITKFVYDRVYPMYENKAVVISNNTYLIINNHGDVVYTFPTGVISDSYFKEDYLVVSSNNKYGYLYYDEQNNTYTLKDIIYDYAKPFKNGFGVVGKYVEKEFTDSEGTYKIVTDKLKYNYLNSSNELLFDNYLFDFADDFNCGYARVANYEDISVRVSEVNYGQTKLLNTLMYKYINEVGDYLHFSYEYHHPVGDIVSVSNDVISLPYATNFKDNVAVVAKLMYSNRLNIYYKEWMIIDNTGNSEYINAIFKKTYYLVGQDNLEDYQSILPRQFIFGNVIKYQDIEMFTVGNVIANPRYDIYYGKIDPYKVVTPGVNPLDITKELFTADWDIVDYQKDEEGNYILNENGYKEEIIPSWMKEYNEKYLDGAKSYAIIKEAAIQPYEMSDIFMSDYYEYPLVKARINKTEKYGLLRITVDKTTYTDEYNVTHDDVYDYNVVLKYILDPVYDKIIF